MPGESYKKGAALSGALLLCLGACSGNQGPSNDGWQFQRASDHVAITAEAEHSDCLVVVNSAEGGFRRTGSLTFPAGVAVSFSPDEFTNSAGYSPGLIEDVLIQCFEPARVVVLP